MSIWQLLGVTVAALAGLASASHAGIYYVATDGSADNDGSYTKPLPNRFPNRFAQGRTEWELPDLWLTPKDD